MKQYLSVREAVLDLFGAEISYVQPVSGGDINRAYRLTINEIDVFMKANSREPRIEACWEYRLYLEYA